jgi:fructose-1,6-bisphosphatase/inositol monophosphatase family enzyme
LRDLVRELALALREQVLPLLGSHAARAHAGGAAGGDVTFAIDAHAEELLSSFLAEQAPDVAFYSEDA